MNILVTGAKGMVGTALCNNLKNIRDGKNKTRPALDIKEIYEYDLDSTSEELDEYCRRADFVFNLAGVNRPENPEDFMKGNFGFASDLLNCLKKHNNKATIMLSSSIQATLAGRFGNSEYGRSKKAGEELFFQYAEETGAKVAVYRFVNLMGHSRPKYNSAVSTFCWAVANDEPFTVNDRSTELELLYIDDLVEGMFDLLEGKEQHCEFDGVETILKEDGRYCCVPVTHKVTLGEIVDLLQEFKEQPTTLMMPKMPDGSFAKKLYSLYLTYLPTDKFKYALKMNVDNRGSFTELVHTADCGQVSINISRPGITKGIDWQREKWQSGLGSKFIHQGEKNAAKYADEVIVLSKGVQDYFKETYGRETHFIPNGVNRPQIREASLITDKFGLKKDSYILFLGRLVPEKGIRYLVEAFKNVKTDKKLVIAGGSSDTDSFMEELKDLAKGDDRILFTGFVQGAMLDELYSNAYIYTLPSDLEGIRLK